MSGFSSVAQYADADIAGQTWTTQFRKTVASAATTTNGWIDYSYFAGSPSANFYASSPSVSAVVEAIRGIYVPTVAPKTQHLKSLNVMAANTTTAVNARQSLILCDYLLYYPFIDTDAIGEVQAMDNTVPIPRYAMQKGSELVNNGDGETSGWWTADADSTVSYVGGRIRVTLTGTNNPRAYQTLTGLTIGKKYSVKGNVFKGTIGGGVIFLRVSNAVEIASSVPFEASNMVDFNVDTTFIATATTLYVGVVALETTAGNYFEMDNISVQEIIQSGGGQVVAVGQSASSAIGTFTFTYTNQDGVSGRISLPNRTFVVSGGGQVVGASEAGASYNPFLLLQAGDSGVQSIQSVTFTGAGGGLMALVIVKPLFFGYVTQECRTTTGVAFGAADEFRSVIDSAGAPQIKDGAVLNIFASGSAGSLASSMLIGQLDTVWN
jgi:hypothetical protein